MRVKNAISGMLSLLLGLTVGSAAAMLVMSPGGSIGSSKVSQRPAIITLDRNWNITGIVTPEHDSNITGAQTNNTLLRNRRRSNDGIFSATEAQGPRDKLTVRANLLMLALIVAGGHRSASP